MNKLITAIGCSIVVGIVAGILVAPKKGDVLRKTISDAAGNGAEKLIDVFASSAKNESGSGDISVSADEILG